jgi:glucose/arabinose dehydrogenase
MSARKRWLLGLGGAALSAALAPSVASAGPAGQAQRPAARASAPQRSPGKVLSPSFEGRDLSRPRIPVVLTEILQGLTQPTDLQPVPGEPGTLAILEKGGRLLVADLAAHAWAPALELEVLTDSEEGLLGLAFHPRFAAEGRFFLNAVVKSGGRDVTQISEWRAPRKVRFGAAKLERVKVLLEVEQPYPNHNAGQLAFGPDGFLYVGLGDGGAAGDPAGRAQDPRSLLGKMLRLDVDGPPARGKAYAIPADNPFVGRRDHLPELWALGLRNPWRYTFDPRGRLIAADVGQDRFEELTFVPRGANLGWDVREGRHCFEPREGCRSEGLFDPFFEYDHEEGRSITGGLVAQGEHVPALRDKYVFGDFVSGRVWALMLPREVGAQAETVFALGKFEVMLSTFGRDADGRLYLADFIQGRVYRIDPAPAAAPKETRP